MSKKSNEEVSLNNRDRIIELGLAIAYYRKLNGMSQTQLSDRANVSRSHLSAIESPAVVRSFSIEVLLSIADALNVDPTDFFNLSPDKGSALFKKS
jgi:Predicted transcriptional regulators